MSSLHSQYKNLGQLEALTFAFYDLVDSVYLKKQLGQSQGVDLALKHNQIASRICEQFKGRVIKHIGDAIMVVFYTPLEGVMASLSFIETIKQEKLPFQTKIGLVHGIVTKIDNSGVDFLGHAVDRCARLTSQALPNQLLTDETTMELIKPFFSDLNQVISRFLGVRELKGIGNIQVYEISLDSVGFVNDDLNISRVQLGKDYAVKSRSAPETVSEVNVELPSLVQMPPAPSQKIKDLQIGRLLEASRLSKPELDTVAISYQNILHIIEKAGDLYIRNVYFSGAFGRGTMIKPLEPIEVAVVMTPPSEQSHEVREVVERLAYYFYQGYPDSTVLNSANHISFTLKGIEFTVIPVLLVIKKGQGHLMIPKGHFWIEQNPEEPIQWMEKAVKKHGPEFLSFLHLVKMWQRVNCSAIKPYHLELLTEFIASQTKLDLSFESFYKWFRFVYSCFNNFKKPFIKDPFHPNSYIDEYLFANSAVFNTFNRQFTDSYNHAMQGISYQRSGKAEKAISKWKTLFGDYWRV